MTENQKTDILRYRSQGVSYGKIARSLGISSNTVKSFCRRHEADGHFNAAPVFTGEITYCENCGQKIRQFAKRKKKRFCSDKCRNAWWNNHLDRVKRKAVYTFACPQCGREFQIYGDSRRKYCSHGCYIAARFRGDERHE